MMLMQDSALRQFLRALGPELTGKYGAPKAILMASAHWLTPGPVVGAAAQLETIYDFYGFPAPTYEITYTPPGDPDLAAEAAGLLAEAGIEADHDNARGLDHGGWVPLKYMYPGADIPVAQVSIQPHFGPAHHLALGAALESLRAQNILVIGSGNLTHNLGDMDRRRGDGAPAAWAEEFASWVADALHKKRLSELVDYSAHAPHAMRAHPTDEHFLPLYFALGAGGAAGEAERIHQSTTGGAVCNDCYLFN